MMDTGTWVLVGRRLPPYVSPSDERKGIESWCGMSSDFDLVPHTGCTGSTAYCIDTGERYMFEETTDTWYPMPTSGGGGSVVPPEGVDIYAGTYSVTPKANQSQVLSTANKLLKNNVTVAKIPYSETDNLANGVTANIAS